MFILKCEVFDQESGIPKCCQGTCHGKNYLIPVTPIEPTRSSGLGYRLDWSIGIQGLVCCSRYEFVRDLSREWWINKARAVGLFDESTARKLMHAGSWHPTFERTSKPVKPQVDRRDSRCPKCGSKWNQVVCDSCGEIA